MFLKDYNIGFVIGLGLGSTIGSLSTVLILKKLKKLDYEEQNKKNLAKVDEIYKFYNDKLKELEEKENKKEQKDIEIEIKEKKKEENGIPIRTVSPKIMFQEKIANEKYEDGEVDPADFNEGSAVLETDRGIRIPRNDRKGINEIYDYSKVHNKNFKDLEKEYERDELKEVITFPHQITRYQFENDGGYVKEDLTYYEQNGVFVDQKCDEVIDAYDENYFGLDNLNKFGTSEASIDGQNDLNEIYLRDNNINVDFRIERNSSEDWNTVYKNMQH